LLFLPFTRLIDSHDYPGLISQVLIDGWSSACQPSHGGV